jgi:hypothetical protein
MIRTVIGAVKWMVTTAPRRLHWCFIGSRLRGGKPLPA